MTNNLEKLDYKKAFEEVLNSMEKEFENGARAMFNHLRKDVTKCYGKKDNCVICDSGNKFLRKLGRG